MKTIPNKVNELAIDITDIRLLEQLQHDAALSNLALARRVGLSAPTCLRRVKRLHDSGLIERQVALLCADKVAALLGHGLCAITEVTLDRQDSAALAAFEQRVTPEAAVQQCYRVSPGPDFVLVLQVPDMPAYLALTQRLLTSQVNVRNVKTYFSVKRSKFGTAVPLTAPAAGSP